MAGRRGLEDDAVGVLALVKVVDARVGDSLMCCSVHRNRLYADAMKYSPPFADAGDAN